ncbi:Stress responsive A/B Barrel Domain protein [Rubripirellula obstinata]|uniref:Stress responsive A/B Barrel Domain protein n=1 Tax=Rubripirellula obstinata TaxID=406547 RepID=A0A5B1CE90_9BACT|nr:Dabb family protein [Rubripirellula obstinata]KAA1257664.1 Stress responsive A/B Barrel Domain protein [Rubripirellula obstinata]
MLKRFSVASPFIAAVIATTLAVSASFSFAEESPSRVLRHAVFFAFNDDSSKEDIAAVVEAFRKLPSQIDTIIDYKDGVATPGAKMADGFTHAFLLTFQDEAGRDDYLPHPAHQAFVEVLKPHKKDVFVVDYWGDPSDTQTGSALMHPVFFQFRDTATDAEVKAVEEDFAGLATKIDTVKHFEWGINNSPEDHDDGFTHCFMVTFDGPEGLAEYLPHPAHQAFVKTLGPVEQIRVIDFVVEDER